MVELLRYISDIHISFVVGSTEIKKRWEGLVRRRDQGRLAHSHSSFHLRTQTFLTERRTIPRFIVDRMEKSGLNFFTIFFLSRGKMKNRKLLTILWRPPLRFAYCGYFFSDWVVHYLWENSADRMASFFCEANIQCVRRPPMSSSSPELNGINGLPGYFTDFGVRD